MNEKQSIDVTGIPAESDRNERKKEKEREPEQHPYHPSQQHHLASQYSPPLEWRNPSHEQFTLPSLHYRNELVNSGSDQPIKSEQQQERRGSYSSATCFTPELSKSSQLDRMSQSYHANAAAVYDAPPQQPPQYLTQSSDYANDVVEGLTNPHGFSYAWHLPHVCAPPYHDHLRYAWQERQGYHDGWCRRYPHQRSTAADAHYYWDHGERRNSTDHATRLSFEQMPGTEVMNANHLSHIDSSDTQCIQKKTQKRKKDPDEPKRPLTAYNIFFRDERSRMLGAFLAASTGEMKDDSQQTETSMASTSTENGQPQLRKRKRKPHGLVGFEEMARTVSRKWHETSDDTKEKYQALAKEDRHRYDREKTAYLMRKNRLTIEETQL